VRLDVFGSALRDDFRPGESDVDLLVEFAPHGSLRTRAGRIERPRRAAQHGRTHGRRRSRPVMDESATSARLAHRARK
jgi:predicted nucleotidyltransferase